MPVHQFKGKGVVQIHHYTVPHHVLELDENLSLLAGSESPSLEGNLVIEGDNLLALKALLPTHAGRVKCVYIDPPYNTGEEGWICNDNLTQPQFKEWIGRVVGKEGDDACRHDKWCCMMYPRLMLLKELMSDDGIIFVSIDDNEVHNLRMMMDEIFGGGKPGDTEPNVIAQLVWKSRKSEDARSRTGVSNDHEYILCYRKTTAATLRGSEKDRSKFSNPDSDPRGEWRNADLTGLATEEARPNLH